MAPVDRLLARIGLDHRPAADAAGLAVVHRAFVAAVPYENLAIQLGETGPLDPGGLCERVLTGGRGGYCFENNTVLEALLRDLGFDVQRRRAVVGERATARTAPVNHQALVVTLPEGAFLADAGLGEGPLDPLPLAPGPFNHGALTWTLEREHDGWWLAQHPWGSFEGFWFADEPVTLDAFAEPHARLSTSPESPFVRTLVVQRTLADRIVTLRSRTLTIVGPGVDERDVLEDEPAFAAALARRLGIDPGALGPTRLGRLWQQACAQHTAFLAR